MERRWRGGGGCGIHSPEHYRSKLLTKRRIDQERHRRMPLSIDPAIMECVLSRIVAMAEPGRIADYDGSGAINHGLTLPLPRPAGKRAG
jgi:hypothetical protein